ncbi:MAG: hypothetical protein ACREJD_01890 [Phycisphaerales bacterium]
MRQPLRSPDAFGNTNGGAGGAGSGGGLPPIGNSGNVFRPGASGIGSVPPAGGAASLSGGSSPNVMPLKDGPEVKPKITAFEQKGGIGRTEDSWQRKSNKTGVGATHVKTFHAKLTGESLEFLDKQINDWMDAHPDHEVKFSTSTVGEWTGKLREPNVIIQVWV